MTEYIFGERLLKSLIAILILLIIYILFNRIMKKIFHLKTGIKKLDSKRNKTIIVLLNSIVKYFLLIVGIIAILSIHGVNMNGLIASLGVVSAVVALAFQDIFKDIFAGMFIIIENQYDVGDTVKIGDFKGEVMALGLRATKLRSLTGEYCFIANRNVYNVINYSIEKSLAIINVDIAYDSNMEKVEKVLDELFNRLEKEMKYLKGKIVLDGIEDLAESGITLRISAETTPLKHLIVQRNLRKEILEAFNKNKINIPYPQVVVHND